MATYNESMSGGMQAGGATTPQAIYNSFDGYKWHFRADATQNVPPQPDLGYYAECYIDYTEADTDVLTWRILHPYPGEATVSLYYGDRGEDFGLYPVMEFSYYLWGGGNSPVENWSYVGDDMNLYPFYVQISKDGYPTIRGQLGYSGTFASGEALVSVGSYDGGSTYNEEGRGGIRLGGTVIPSRVQTIGWMWRARSSSTKLVPPDPESGYHAYCNWKYIENDGDDVLMWQITHNYPGEAQVAVYSGKRGEINPLPVLIPSMIEWGGGWSPLNNWSYVGDSMNLYDYYVIVTKPGYPATRCQLAFETSLTGGYATVGTNVTQELGGGGVRLGGTVNVGGIKVGGVAIDHLTANSVSIGGVVCSGAAEIHIQDTIEGLSGGVTVGGNSTANVTWSAPVSGGVLLNGQSLVRETITVGDGQVNVNGAADTLMVWMPVPTGGVVLNGSNAQTFIDRGTTFTGGASLGGQARVENLKEYPKLKSGIGRTFNNDNLIKSIERDLREPARINIYPLVEMPEVDETGFRHENLPTWCDIKDITPGCDAAIPPIVKQRQGLYMPAKKRTTVRDRTIARIT